MLCFAKGRIALISALCRVAVQVRGATRLDVREADIVTSDTDPA